VVVAPDVQREAAVADAAVAAEPDAQQAAAVEPDAQQGAASDAQQGAEEAAVVGRAAGGAAVAAASDVQQAAVSAPMVGAVKLRVRRLAASVEPAETAAVRLLVSGNDGFGGCPGAGACVGCEGAGSG